MARAPLAAAMVGKTVAGMPKDGKVPAEYRRLGNSIDGFILDGYFD